MFNSQIIEIITGLIFIYLILSLLGTTINELIAGILHLRGKNLKKSLSYMLSDPDNKELLDKFSNHPLFVTGKRFQGEESDGRASHGLGFNRRW
jgi:hypothetical protein